MLIWVEYAAKHIFKSLVIRRRSKRKNALEVEEKARNLPNEGLRIFRVSFVDRRKIVGCFLGLLALGLPFAVPGGAF